MILEYIKEYQTLLTGFLAVSAASAGAIVLWKSTSRQIKAQFEHEAQRKQHEKLVLAETLLAEIEANFELFDEILKAMSLNDITTALKGYFYYDKKFPEPSNLVFKANGGRLGLLGKKTATTLLTTYYHLDILFNRFEKIVSTWDPKLEPEFEAKFDWEKDFQLIIGSTQLKLVLCQKNLKRVLKDE